MLKAYAAEKFGKTLIALVNKASIDTEVLFTADEPFHRAAQWRLTGPALDATHGIEFGGAVVNNGGTWNPQSESLPVRNGALHIAVPAVSAALIFLS